MTIRFKQILGKLEGSARDILQEKPLTWEHVRNLLIRTQADPTDIGTQILHMERISYTNSPLHTYNLLRAAQTRMLDKIQLTNDPDVEKDLLRTTVKKRTFVQFRKSLPQACQGALTNRGCNSIHEAIQILQEEDFHHEDRIMRTGGLPSTVEQRPSDKTIPNHNNNFQRYPINRNHNNRPSNFRSDPQRSAPAQTNSQPQRRVSDNPSQQTRRSKPWRFHAPNFDVNVVGHDRPGEAMDVEENFRVQASRRPGELPQEQIDFLMSGCSWDD